MKQVNIPDFYNQAFKHKASLNEVIQSPRSLLNNLFDGIDPLRSQHYKQSKPNDESLIHLFSPGVHSQDYLQHALTNHN